MTQQSKTYWTHFAMELFLTSVLPRHEASLATHKEGAKEDASHHQYVLSLPDMKRLQQQWCQRHAPSIVQGGGSTDTE